MMNQKTDTFGDCYTEKMTVRLTKVNKERLYHMARIKRWSMNMMINSLIEDEHTRECEKISKKTGRDVSINGDVLY